MRGKPADSRISHDFAGSCFVKVTLIFPELRGPVLASKVTSNISLRANLKWNGYQPASPALFRVFTVEESLKIAIPRLSKLE